MCVKVIADLLSGGGGEEEVTIDIESTIFDSRSEISASDGRIVGVKGGESVERRK